MSPFSAEGRRRPCFEGMLSLSGGEDLVEVGSGHDLSAGLFAVLVELHLELEAVLALGVLEAGNDHLCVGEKDAVEGQAGSLDGVLVHFRFLGIIILLLNIASL